MGSMNKMFTGMAVAQLVQAGQAKGNRPAVKIPDRLPNADVASKVTIHHC